MSDTTKDQSQTHGVGLDGIGTDTLAFSGLTPQKSVIVIILVVSAVILPIAFMGVPDGYDLIQHIRFAAAYRDAILAGEFIPKWPAQDNFGFGGIGIRYYPPLAYYILAFTRILTGSWYHSFWITTYFWALLGSAGVYLWIKEWTSNAAATLAAVFYIIIPYHTFQIYQAVLYAEFAAAGIVPFCFLYLTRVCQRRRWINVVALAIAYSMLILTHIPSAIIASLCMALYGLLIIDWKQLGTTVVKLVSAVALGCLAASFHLIKALIEVDWVKHNSAQFFGKGYYDYRSYFFPIYFSAPWSRYVEKMLWHFDTIIFLTLMFFGLTAVAFFLNRARKTDRPMESKNGRAVIITGLFSLFMLSIASSFIWNSISALQKIQFPWRWLSTASLMGSVMFAVAVPDLLFKAKKVSRLALYPLILFILVVLLFDISQNIIPSIPLSKAVFEDKVANMYNEEGCQCWWPIWAQSEAFAQPERIFAGDRKAVVVNWGGESRDFSVEAGEAIEMRVATFYHPYWLATVNGEPASVANDANGAILVHLPAEESQVHLFFREPEILRIAAIMSALAWIGFALILAGYFFRRNRLTKNE